MSAPPPLRWWGWGDRAVSVPPGLADLLDHELGAPVLRARGAVPPMLPHLPESRLAGDPLIARLEAICGAGGVSVDPDDRLRHAAGRSYLDLLDLRGGRLDVAPDAVVRPGDAAAVAAVLADCGAGDCAVVPFGGGTSVVGGVRPLAGAHRAVVSLDLRRLDGCREVDPLALTATLGAGLTGPAAEAALAAQGLTLGHRPQSFEYATIGGFAATRSAGQASGGFGRFDELVRGIRLVAPGGEVVVAAHPASAAGPSILQLILGSEGRLGVITDVTVAVRPRTGAPRYEGWWFGSFGDGVAVLRALVQGRVAPDVARLSDREETRVGVAMAAHGGIVERLGRRYLALRGAERGCLLIAGWESDALVAGARQAEARVVLRRHGGIALGASPGRAWARGRFEGPYLRDTLLDCGVLVETLETATTWGRVESLRTAIVAALREALDDDGRALIGCHVSHVYPSGASLYVTVIARGGVDAAERWRAAKAAACEAILAGGGTITHHHAVGTDHRAYLEREIGGQAVGALRALARQLDPAGIMNPGKLIPDD